MKMAKQGGWGDFVLKGSRWLHRVLAAAGGCDATLTRLVQLSESPSRGGG